MTTSQQPRRAGLLVRRALGRVGPCPAEPARRAGVRLAVLLAPGRRAAAPPAGSRPRRRQPRLSRLPYPGRRGQRRPGRLTRHKAAGPVPALTPRPGQQSGQAAERQPAAVTKGSPDDTHRNSGPRARSARARGLCRCQPVPPAHRARRGPHHRRPDSAAATAKPGVQAGTTGEPGGTSGGVLARALLGAANVLAVIARPGQESADLGALLHVFRRRGARLSLLCLTRGEASPLNSTCERLETIRPFELQVAAGLLGVSSVIVADYPDGGLRLVPRGRRPAPGCGRRPAARRGSPAR